MRRGKFCGVFSFAAGIFPCPQKAREKPSAPGSQFVFFLRRRLFKLGRGYNTASGDGVAWTAAILEKEAGRKLASNDNLAYTFAI
jgi:hypothetical protein